MGTETKRKNVPIYFYYLTIETQKNPEDGANRCIFFGNVAAYPFQKLE